MLPLPSHKGCFFSSKKSPQILPGPRRSAGRSRREGQGCVGRDQERRPCRMSFLPRNRFTNVPGTVGQERFTSHLDPGPQFPAQGILRLCRHCPSPRGRGSSGNFSHQGGPPVGGTSAHALCGLLCRVKSGYLNPI